MAQIYNLLFKAPTALAVKTTLHSHHIGAAALGLRLAICTNHTSSSISERSLHSDTYKATGLK